MQIVQEALAGTLGIKRSLCQGFAVRRALGTGFAQRG